MFCHINVMSHRYHVTSISCLINMFSHKYCVTSILCHVNNTGESHLYVVTTFLRDINIWSHHIMLCHLNITCHRFWFHISITKKKTKKRSFEIQKNTQKSYLQAWCENSIAPSTGSVGFQGRLYFLTSLKATKSLPTTYAKIASTLCHINVILNEA